MVSRFFKIELSINFSISGIASNALLPLTSIDVWTSKLIKLSELFLVCVFFSDIANELNGNLNLIPLKSINAV